MQDIRQEEVRDLVINSDSVSSLGKTRSDLSLYVRRKTMLVERDSSASFEIKHWMQAVRFFHQHSLLLPGLGRQA